MILRFSRRGARALLAAGCVAALSAGTAVVAAPAVAAPVTGGSSEDVVAGAWIVTLEDGESPRGVSRDHARDHGATVDHVYEHALRGYAARMSGTAAARVARDSRVAAVVADRRVSLAKPTVKPGGGGGSTTAPPQVTPTGVARIGALAATSTADIDGVDVRVDVDVAVIDTGIDTGHPDLVITSGKNCVRNGSTDDGNGHGTHVAGTIGAIDNSVGVVGVAPGARVWPVRVLDNRGSGTWSQVICGIDYVTANAELIEVANMSLGGGGSEQGCTDNGMQQAICGAVAAGVTFVVAAGNDAADAAGFVPAAYDQVITVSALADSDGAPGGSWSPDACRGDQEESLADFSNYGADVDLIAPGVCITSTWKDGGYSTISGTSMAAPHVAGAAALHAAAQPGASPAQVRTFLQDRGTREWARNPQDPAGSLTLDLEPLLDVSSF